LEECPVAGCKDGRLRAFFVPMRHAAKPIYWHVGDWRKNLKLMRCKLLKKILAQNLRQHGRDGGGGR